MTQLVPFRCLVMKCHSCARHGNPNAYIFLGDFMPQCPSTLCSLETGGTSHLRNRGADGQLVQNGVNPPYLLLLLGSPFWSPKERSAATRTSLVQLFRPGVLGGTQLPLPWTPLGPLQHHGSARGCVVPPVALRERGAFGLCTRLSGLVMESPPRDIAEPRP